MSVRSAHKHDVAKDILIALESGALLSPDLLEPERIQSTLQRFWRLSRHSPAQLKRSFAYLERQGFINLQTEEDLRAFRLTDKGRRKIRRWELADLSIPLPLRWDGRWRLVLFDVPEVRKSARNALSIYLKAMGFFKLQDSVWLHPYPCEEQVATLRHALDLSDHLRIIVAESIENDTALREHFHLAI